MALTLSLANIKSLLFSKIAPFTGVTIASATNASPSVVTSTAHGRQVGDVVLISGVTGNTALNGLRVIATAPSANTYTLNDFVAGTAVNGNGTTGGTIVVTVLGITLSPGDVADLQHSLEGVTGGAPQADFNRSVESSIKTLLGA